MHLKKLLDRLCGADTGYWSQRLHAQVDYLLEALKDQSAYTDDALRAVLEELAEIKKSNGALTKADVLSAEEKLSYYVPLCKSFDLRMVSHAHIDMNWQWGYDETVGVVIDTFRTMLKLLEEYPQFIFTQSQASVYEIVEKYAPDLLPAIAKYVKEGRWEVIASTWVEPDKNMINAESMARHILYTKKYMKQLLDIAPEQLQIDFEPDTFGHSENIPEILNQGGVKYYYHCRGYDGEQVYRWRAPSGAEVLALRDPEWYMLIDMDYHMMYHVPSFCRHNHCKSAIRMYGVGDHGGGPTRRDLERIIDMQTWPLAPNITFSTLHGFFRELEETIDRYPVVQQEHNCVFTGCYTSQARIKQANRHGEDHLYDCEALCAMARAAGCDLSGMPDFAAGWKPVLFNQFHDILPGSGIRETREHALGIAQNGSAVCVGNANRALNAMGQRVSTNLFAATCDRDSFSEGAGVGYNTVRREAFNTHFNIGAVGKASGLVRPYTFFNPTQYDREELVELTLWDWSEPLEATRICDSEGNDCPFDVSVPEKKYWQHIYSKLNFVVKVPAFGYANYYVTEADLPANRIPVKGSPKRPDSRVHEYGDYPVVLENPFLRATFDRRTMKLVSLWDKTAETEMLSEPSAYFRLNDERDHDTQSAWRISPFGKTEILNDSNFVKMTVEPTGEVVQRVEYEIAFRSSVLTVAISLAPCDCYLRFSLTADWNEFGVPAESTPMLQFHVPYGYDADTVRYDVPGGYVDRQKAAHDVPAILYGAPLNINGSSIMLTSDCKYGYRAWENAISITLFHAGWKPDPKPDCGIHHMEIGLGIVRDTNSMALKELAFRFAHPLYCYSNDSHEGSLPEKCQLLNVSGDAFVESVKLSEDGDGIIVRVTQPKDSGGSIRVGCDNARSCSVTDILERPAQSQSGSAAVEIPAGANRTLKLTLGKGERGL